jgi:hypothetical protein
VPAEQLEKEACPSQLTLDQARRGKLLSKAFQNWVAASEVR